VAGSGGGVDPLYAEPGYQKPVVPAALATSDGTTRAGRVVPDISANAGGFFWIGYTGAVTSGVYTQILEGGTSASAPLMAGLEADAMQAAGHAIGFANPALYKLYRTPAISDVTPVSPDDPPMLIGDSIYFGPGNDLDTIGEAQPPLVTTNGYDDTTGIGAPGESFLTAFAGR
jgi:subtilase family serine protease